MVDVTVQSHYPEFSHDPPKDVETFSIGPALHQGVQGTVSPCFCSRPPQFQVSGIRPVMDILGAPCSQGASLQSRRDDLLSLDALTFLCLFGRLILLFVM